MSALFPVLLSASVHSSGRYKRAKGSRCYGLRTIFREFEVGGGDPGRRRASRPRKFSGTGAKRHREVLGTVDTQVVPGAQQVAQAHELDGDDDSCQRIGEPDCRRQAGCPLRSADRNRNRLTGPCGPGCLRRSGTTGSKEDSAGLRGWPGGVHRPPGNPPSSVPRRRPRPNADSALPEPEVHHADSAPARCRRDG